MHSQLAAASDARENQNDSEDAPHTKEGTLGTFKYQGHQPLPPLN
jgi:hypothetical protein